MSRSQWGGGPVFLLAALGAGCSVPLDAPLDLTTVNTCETTSDCGEGAACEGNKCVATSYDLGGLLLAVHPHADANVAADTSYVVDPSALGVQLVSPAAGGAPFLTRFDVTLPPPVSIQGGEVVLDPSIVLPSACVLGLQRSVPANLTFFRVPQFAGLPADTVPVTTAIVPAEDGSYPFDVDLVSDAEDHYDVYIVPLPVSGCPTFPPYFLPGQSIQKGGPLTWTLPPPGTLTGTITGLTDTTDWQVDVLEWTRGLVVSSGTTLIFEVGSSGVTVTAQVAWSDPTEPPILRLSPVTPSSGVPTNVAVARPTVFWTLQGAVFGGTAVDPEVNFTVSDLAVDPLTVTGQIVGANVTVGVMSQLTLQSQALQGSNAGNAAFATSATTDADGNFAVDLPPGEYSVRVVPLSDDTRSITDFTVQSPAGAAGPVSLQLQPKGTLVGTITTTTGQPVGSTPVEVTPSQQLAQTYLASTHTLGPVTTRAASTTTDGAGGFSLSLDVGSSDLVVQPDPLTNLPWLIRPQVTVATASNLAVTVPAFLGGTVRALDGTPIADAEIDAWFPVRDPSAPSGLTGTVIKIATTFTDPSGAYTLVLPSLIGPAGPSL